MRLFLLPIIACVAIATAADTTTIPEIEGPKARYQQALTDIRAKRDREAAPTNKTYAESLAKLYKQLDAEGEAAGALAVKTEQERFAKGVEPTDAEQRKMTGLLRALRTAYEKERDRPYSTAAKDEEVAHRAWASGLTALAERLAKLGQHEKAAIARAELAKLSSLPPEPVAPAAVPPTPLPVPTAPPVAQTTTQAPRLHALLANKIKDAIAGKSTMKTALSGKREGTSETPPDGALLIGLNITEFGWRGKSVKTVEPIFLGRDGVFHGKARGKPTNNVIRIEAKEGYAIGGLNTYAHDRIAAIQVVFMKIIPLTGKLDPRAESRYTSPWYGTQGDGPATRLGGDGRLAIGVHGGMGADTDTIGLVMMP